MSYNPFDYATGRDIRTPRGYFCETSLSIKQMEEAGYGFHHMTDDGVHHIMTNGKDAYAVKACEDRPEAAEEPQTKREFYIDTPVGRLHVYAKSNVDPGVYIDLVGVPDADGELMDELLCCVEYESYTGVLQTVVYQPGDDEPVSILKYEMTEQQPATADADRTPEETPPQYKVMVKAEDCEKLAYDMIQALDSGMQTENGDRYTVYFVIAKDATRTGHTISISLTENIANLPENEWFYGLHVVDDIFDKPCELRFTEHLDKGELAKLIEGIVKDLEKAEK